MIDFIGRGSWIRTNDLQYPKLPRYQAALYPDVQHGTVDTRSEDRQQGTIIGPAQHDAPAGRRQTPTSERDDIIHDDVIALQALALPMACAGLVGGQTGRTGFRVDFGRHHALGA